MNRLMSYEQGEAIGLALDMLPRGIAEWVGDVEFLTGTDPVFAGLHGYPHSDDGRSFRDTAHCSYRYHSFDGSTTIVLPVLEPPVVVIHELGHVLDEALGFEHLAQPVSEYGETNRWEAFAEAFVAHFFWHEALTAEVDDETHALFEALQ